jgi:two-component system sensor histidine kinase BarA
MQSISIIASIILTIAIAVITINLVKTLRRKDSLIRVLQVNQIKVKSEISMKTRFVENISHDLRTPLNGILGFAELISISTNIEQVNGYGKIVYASAKELNELVNAILDIAKNETGNMNVVCANTEVRRLCESVAEIHGYCAKKKGLILSIDYEDALPVMIYTDRTKLMQLLNKLLHNAVKFTAHGAVFFHISKNNSNWIFRISDSGIGMNQKVVDQLFDRSKCRKSKMLGTACEQTGVLGMLLCKELAVLLGGSIHISSTPGVGTVAEIWMPFHEKYSYGIKS